MKRYYFIYPLLAWMAMFLLPSCVREDLLHEEENVIPGLETTISLKINVPDMDIATRADMAPGTDSKLNSLWVGIFSATSGECTYAGFVNTLPSDVHGTSNFLELTLNTKSGSSYIVAVGNPEGNYGYQYDSSNETVSRTELKNLLPAETGDAINFGGEGKDFTWNSFKNIAIRQLDVEDVSTPYGNLVMSGVYYGNTSDHTNGSTPPNYNPTPEDWENANETPVVIPVLSGTEAISLPGAIHLRRLISHVKFQISPVRYTGPDESKSGLTIVEIIPQSYKIVNIPYTSWLYERKSLGENNQPIGSANSGDVIRLNNSTTFNYGDGPTALKPNYRTSASFNSQYFTKINDSFEFDFWMLENKRWALSSLNGEYDRREAEFKDLEEKNGESLNRNSGVYTALCESRETETMNNCATFVELRCQVVYTKEGLSAINPPNSEDIEYRTADAVYTIHLGGINNNWDDFSHRRNHQYTYHVTVMDVNTIIVEAEENKEPRPGIEGIVTDVMNGPIDLDAHYGWFNIKLSNLQRTGGTDQDGNSKNVFPFYIKVYDENNEPVYIDQTTYKDFPEYYWNWIEFRPTTGPDVLAAYKPYYVKDDKGNDTKERYRENDELTTFRLNEIADINTYPGNNGSTNKDETTEQWYTVFVNEYVYETTTNEEKNNWVKYVNKFPRMCWLNTDGVSSKDKESTHIKSQYVIRQSSIQTFYDIPAGHDIENEPLDAIGLEHVNEVWGFNLRWDLNNNTVNVANNNGRHNTWLYLKSGATRGDQWENYYDPYKLQEIEGIRGDAYQKDLYVDLSKGPYYLPSIFTYPYREQPQDYNRGRHNINYSNYLKILDACMNRNRDNNGNGKIDLEELRWYVPASSEILDIVLGRNSLEDPLMDYSKNNALNSIDGTGVYQKHHANTRFHYATSNNRVLWAEEGVTINPESDNINDGWNLPPQQIRCARALGTDLSTDQTGDLSPAFSTEKDENGYVVRIFPTYYEKKNMRPYTDRPLEPHQETSELNRLCFDGFEFRKELIEFEPDGDWENGPGFHYHAKDNQSLNQYNNNRHRKKYQWHDIDYMYGDYNQWQGQYIGQCWINLYRLQDTNSDFTEFVEQHDDILQEASRRCQKEFGSTWRIPNMKEAALIKVVLENNNIYKTDRSYSLTASPRPYEKETINGYDIGSFLTGTYREYGITGNESRRDKSGYYTSIYYPENPTVDDRDARNHLLGRIHCVSTGDRQHYYIRCVRDLSSLSDY